ncbi:3-hydroxyacyl-CoA dehydrogenase NAD-binding domain-containing protein [Salipiger sp.]|uniref:3-hydroxyacyl-CoA dehydrogenase NAD-binding domain-containing protein n=1 Tax=Salipiger sp. TaxID=2078585 RepID=UPI003A97AE1D
MKTIGIVGFGTIGQRWTAAFAHHGHDVRVYDPDPEAGARFDGIRDGLFADLADLHGIPAERGAITLSADMAEALGGVDFVQENGPEDLPTKRALLAEIETHVGPEVIIASSSSALLVTQMQAGCRHPERIVLAHPFNPAHIMPLVEIVGGDRTAPDVPARARALYDAIGKKPVMLNREITGHLALRLMGAMWREAIALVRDGVASVEDVDRAFIYGPGPKWGVQGSFISNGLNAEGMDEFLRKYGKTYEDIWADLGDATLDAATRAKVAEAAEPLLTDRDALRANRDAAIVAMLKLIADKGPL